MMVILVNISGKRNMQIPGLPYRSSGYLKKGLLLLLFLVYFIDGQCRTNTWEKWTKTLESEKTYDNPYSDVTLEVFYTAPDGQEYRSFGYWKGAGTFEITYAFPIIGKWTWRTVCSDRENEQLNNQMGSVNVKSYKGRHPLYRNGFLKVSESGRYLTFNNNNPFLWMGCTAWIGPANSTYEEWCAYIDDRAEKRFTIIQVTPFRGFSWINRNDILKTGELNRLGEEPFFGYYDRINPSFWNDLSRKIDYANRKGLVVAVMGLPGWQFYINDYDQRKKFLQYLTGMLAGNFVLFSPAGDTPFSERSDQLAMELDSINQRHLITQHPGTPSGQLVNIESEAYFDKPYLDFSVCQTGHNGGRRDRCVWNAINWNLSLYNRQPPKPVINAEAFYHGNPSTDDERYRGTGNDARGLGWYSWLSGAMGYTYGALGLWNWGLTTGGILVPWDEAINLNSSYHMQYMVDFFSNISWWELEPWHDAILNQNQDTLRKMVFAKNEAGTLGVAYLPPGTSIEINMKIFTQPVMAQWFNPRKGLYLPILSTDQEAPSQSFTPPTDNDLDWVLLLNSSQINNKKEK